MKIIIAMPAKAPKDPLVLEGLHYLSRCRGPYQTDALLFDPRAGSEDDALKRKAIEGSLLLKKTQKSFRIALFEGGKQFNSEQFSAYLEKLLAEHAQISFIIGGAFGLCSELVSASDASLSLSPMTMPHRLAFLVLSEQLYRASEIRKGSPYHK